MSTARGPVRPGRVQAAAVRSGGLWRLKLEGATHWHRVAAAAPDAVRALRPRPGQYVTLTLNTLGGILALSIDGYGVDAGDEDPGPLTVSGHPPGQPRGPRRRRPY